MERYPPCRTFAPQYPTRVRHRHHAAGGGSRAERAADRHRPSAVRRWTWSRPGSSCGATTHSGDAPPRPDPLGLPVPAYPASAPHPLGRPDGDLPRWCGRKPLPVESHPVGPPSERHLPVGDPRREHHRMLPAGRADGIHDQRPAAVPLPPPLPGGRRPGRLHDLLHLHAGRTESAGDPADGAGRAVRLRHPGRGARRGLAGRHDGPATDPAAGPPRRSTTRNPMTSTTRSPR
jgi:hypothetical protein